ncbi:MAG: methionyl-tRNA formyltransferase [Bacillota bacterium]|nr:methionyl-tRNA formyltransferase [Bacillota bacterium]
MRLAFFGTPEFAVPSLEALVASGHEVALVVTQPDRPAGRGYRLAPSPVKEAALARRLPLAQPESVATGEFRDELRRLDPEACVVVAFGQKITPGLLDVPPKGWVNVHASLLPRWRGAAPVARAIMAGDAVTGVTTIYLDSGWDTGDMILRRPVPIDPEENAGELSKRLAGVGAEVLAETMALVARGAAPREPQDEAEATLAPRLRPEEGEIDWTRPALELHNLVRGLAPSPGAYTFWRGRRLKIWRTRVREPGEEEPRPGEAGGGAPGTVSVSRRAVCVATGRGLLQLLEVQGESGRVLPGEEFARGQRLAAGERLGR